MSRVTCLAFLSVAGALLVATGFLCESTGRAQEKQEKFVTPKIVTTDGVRLNVLFYPSPKKNSPAVIMLHPVGIGESINQPGWKALAETLQSYNYSVAIFDFRGHGESKSIEEPADFWKLAANLKSVKKSSKEGDAIDVKDFIKSGTSYMPVLVNDIAAVKMFLDKRNDTGECNTANTIVIGAETGATLGAIWINSQWNCFKYTLPPQVGFIKPVPMVDKRAEGNDIIGAVWLNMPASLSGRPVAPTVVLRNACYEHAMPAAFFVGQDDAKAKDFAKTVTEKLKPKGSKKHDFILPVEMPKTNLAGIKLLQKGLKTNDVIVEYLDKVLAEKSNDWDMRNYNETAFGWRTPATKQFLPAKRKDQKILQFDTYEKFISQ